MSDLLPYQLPRLVYVVFSLYALALLLFRWQITRVMTVERRFLFLFLILELVTTVLSGVLKVTAQTPVDPASWATVLTQAFLTAYLYYATPPSFHRWHHRFTRRADATRQPVAAPLPPTRGELP